MTITRVTLKQLQGRKSKSDWARVDALTDEEIEAAVAADPDAPPLMDSEWFKGAMLELPEQKSQIALRVDSDVLRWFRAQGKGWQTQVNAILRSYASAHGAELSKAGPLRSRSGAVNFGRKKPG